jgi:hypothetical protein
LKTESSVAGVEIFGSADPVFRPAVAELWGRAPDDILTPALPFSVVARNGADRTVALLSVRFDMRSSAGKTYSVVHYADSLRYPENADLVPGGMRFMCAEPLYTRLVLHREAKIDPRGPMNLANLRKALSIRASIDCLAFDDGHFQGNDSLGAFDRLMRERAAEQELLAALVNGAPESLLLSSMETPGLRALARKLHQGFVAGGVDEIKKLAEGHRCRIALHR